MKILYRIIIFLVIFLSIGISTFLLFNDEITYGLLVSDNFPEAPVEVYYAINMYDLKYVVGDADYVFVGLVIDYIDTIHDTPSEIPDTIYRVEVIENIKGKLLLDTEIELIKGGGVNKNYLAKTIMRDDTMPKKDEYYIFSVRTKSSGEIFANGINTTVKIENMSDYKYDIEYIKFVSAYESEIISDRTRYKSTYDNE